MGYEFHITRKSRWSDDADGNRIDEDEWLALARSVPDLEPIFALSLEDVELKLPVEWRSHRWTAHPELGRDGPIFDLRQGNIAFGGIDPATHAFALKLAERLNARVVGDDDESRVDINTLVNAVGIAMGQFVADATGLAWVIATDEHGSDLALYGQPGDILVYPANAAAKRITRGERSFVAALVSELVIAVRDRRSAG